jgi:hypothetical protein
MMADNILKMEYPEADQMITVLNQAATNYGDLITELEGIATALEGGAMLGKAGDALAAGIRRQAIGKINELIAALTDGARYVNMEKEDMQAAEKKSAGLF